jgi:hypothetical protein
LQEDLRQLLATTRALPLVSDLTAPFNLLQTCYVSFDHLFLATVLLTADPHDDRIAGKKAEALGLIRTLRYGAGVDFFNAALLLWRKIREPATAGGMRLLRQALELLSELELHSCKQCLSATEICDHACCRQHFLYTGLALHVLTHDNNFWRVSPAAQDHAVAPTAPMPLAAAPLPPTPLN